MKKSFLGLLVAIMAAAPGAHADRDDQLIEALQILKTNVSVPGLSDQIDEAAWKAPVVIMAGAAAVNMVTHLPRISKKTWKVFRINRRVLRAQANQATLYAVAMGGAFFLLARWVDVIKSQMEDDRAIDYATPDGLRRFFALPIDEQFLRAREDQSFTSFLIGLGQSYVNLQRGFEPVYRSPKG